MTVRVRFLLLAVVVTLLGIVGPTAALAQSGVPPWAPCGRSDPETKPVKTYPVQPPVGGPPRTFAVLLCGNDRYGQRHIAGKHGGEWSDLALLTGGPWQSLADFAITQTLTVPQPGYPQFDPGANTWTYKSPLQIKDQEGHVRANYWVVVGVAAQDGKVLTGFYTRDPR